MDSSDLSSEGDGPFYDASDDFPFYDCVDFDWSEQCSPAPSATLRRRRPSRDSKQNEGHVNKLSSGRDPAGSTPAPPTASIDDKDDSSTTTTANGERIRDSLESTSADAQTHEDSVVTEVDGLPVGESLESLSAPSDNEAPPSSLLISLGRDRIAGKLSSLWNMMWEGVSPFVYQWLKEHESIWKLMSRFGWGLFWAIYVCSMLFGLMITATLATGFIMRCLVEEPIRIEEKLNFDYTKHHPVAYVPVVSCGAVDSGAKFKELAQIRSSQQSRVILPNQKLEVTVSLKLPESEYNKNLGIFQIRVDFLSSNGQTLASSTHPCMLLFKSEPVRLVLTMLKIAPLLAGYISESQTIKVKFHGFTEGNMPTSCIRVLVQQRAEYHPGAGIPEIYGATFVLESELPLLRRILWCWRKTIFIWTVMVSFTMELLFILLFCRPVILPRTKRRSSSTEIHAPNA